MPNPSDIQKLFPSPSREFINRVWTAVPENDRAPLEETFKGLPLDRNPLNMLIDLAVIHYKTSFAASKKVAIIGPANVGKSTLFNQFVRAKADHAEVSPIPGTTRVNKEADAGIFAMIDTPGADAVGAVGEAERASAFAAAKQADFLILMFDAMQGIKQTELVLYEDLLALRKPFIIILNKIDLTHKHRTGVLAKAAENLGVSTEQILPVSALKGEGMSNILMSILAADPSLTISMARAMPQYRQKIAWRSIVTSSSLAAAIALTPLPVIDFVPLAATQAGLVLTIARIYDYKITPARAKELFATFGLGMIGRTLFQQLSKLGGVPGWLLSSAIASSMTAVMGYASMVWFEKGERVSQKAMLEMSKNLTATMLMKLKSTFKRKPSKQKMEGTMGEILSETSLSVPPTQTTE
jgi:small GTP-binding protein